MPRSPRRHTGYRGPIRRNRASLVEAFPELPAAIMLLDHLVGTIYQRDRNVDAKCLGCLQVDDQLEFGRLLDGKVRWLRALEDSLNVGCSPMIQGTVIRTIRDQRANAPSLAAGGKAYIIAIPCFIAESISGPSCRNVNGVDWTMTVVAHLDFISARASSNSEVSPMTHDRRSIRSDRVASSVTRSLYCPFTEPANQRYSTAPAVCSPHARIARTCR